MSEEKIAYTGPTVKDFAQIAPIIALWSCTAPNVCACGKLDCAAPGKHPCFRVSDPKDLSARTKWNATQDLETIDAWIAKARKYKLDELNYGAAMGKAVPFGEPGDWLIAIDVDPRNGGDELLGRYEAAYGKLPHTWTTLTGGGGQHYYFRVKLPKAPRCIALIGGIEIKAEGGYVILPPSMHASGKRYAWDLAAVPREVPLAYAPAWVVDELLGSRTAPARKHSHGPSAGDPAATLIGHAMGAAGMRVGPQEATGIRPVECPWADEHSDGRGDGEDTSSVLLIPTLEAPRFGGWRCKHAHCAGRGPRELLDKLPIEAWREADERYPHQLQRAHRERLGFPPDDLIAHDGPPPDIAPRDFDDDDFSSPPPPLPPAPSDEDGALAPAPRPIIRLGNDMDRICREARSALGGDHLVFRQGNALVAIADKSLMVCKPGTIQELIAYVADIEKYDARSRSWVRCVLPKEVCTTVLESAKFDGIPPLKGLAHLPYVGPKGDLVTEPGFNPDSGYFLLDSENLRKVVLPTELSQRTALAGMQVLRDVTCDIPFADDTHGYGWIALLLTMIARPMIDGCTPLFAFDATAPGSGKTILVKTAALIAFGQEYLCSAGIANQDEEMRKAITSMVASGSPLMLLDNFVGILRNPPLEAAITTGHWDDRLLSTNTHVSAPMQMIFAVTGNHLRLGDDIARRTFVCRLEPTQSIHERGDFKNGELDVFAKNHRFALYTAALTILAAHAAAGSPEAHVKARPGFEGWSRKVASAIAWAGGPDVTGLFADVGDETSDANEAEVFREVVAENIDRMHVRAEFEMRDVFDRLWGEQNQRAQWLPLVDALDMLRTGPERPWTVKELALVFRSLRSRPLGKYRLLSRRVGGRALWRLVDK